MNHRPYVIVSLITALALLGASCGYKSSSPTTNQNSTTMTSGTAVSIQDMAFSPSSLTVKVGDTVTWTNNDSTSHTVTGNNGGPQSGTLSRGQTYSFTFTTTGTFTYVCSLHPSMTGSVVVQP